MSRALIFIIWKTYSYSTHGDGSGIKKLWIFQPMMDLVHKLDDTLGQKQ